ncbi:MAG: response regulator [Acidobacteria bacterium]|nr:response regulator [Acidobacteriota bacterium]
MSQLLAVAAEVEVASSCEQTAQLLRENPNISLVLTDLCLPDGSWFDILNLVSELHPGAAVVACARTADERLWTHVIEAGGFDILVEPYEEDEVNRILGAAVKARPPRRLAAAS